MTLATEHQDVHSGPPDDHRLGQGHGLLRAQASEEQEQGHVNSATAHACRSRKHRGEDHQDGAHDLAPIPLRLQVAGHAKPPAAALGDLTKVMLAAIPGDGTLTADAVLANESVAALPPRILDLANVAVATMDTSKLCPRPQPEIDLLRIVREAPQLTFHLPRHDSAGVGIRMMVLKPPAIVCAGNHETSDEVRQGGNDEKKTKHAVLRATHSSTTSKMFT
mmetsp:Transcript_51495/g.110151  ORF Transcript_51495/g.110151 Transcript_51495/m.110151 type:complete len:221 (+) Transcript_51495:233-895(+)